MTYTNIVLTLIFITQFARVVQNTIQLRRQTKFMSEEYKDYVERRGKEVIDRAVDYVKILNKEEAIKNEIRGKYEEG